MRIIYKTIVFLKKNKIPNSVVVLFSILFLFFSYAFSSLHVHPDLKLVLVWSLLGCLFSVSLFLVWAIRWKKLDRNYSQIAIFFFVASSILLAIHIRNLLNVSMDLWW